MSAVGARRLLVTRTGYIAVAILKVDLPVIVISDALDDVLESRPRVVLDAYVHRVEPAAIFGSNAPVFNSGDVPPTKTYVVSAKGVVVIRVADVVTERVGQTI